MTSHRSPRRYRKSQGRHVWVFSELNHDLRPEQVAKILTAAGLEQARLEVEARAQRQRFSTDGDTAAKNGDDWSSGDA